MSVDDDGDAPIPREAGDAVGESPEEGLEAEAAIFGEGGRKEEAHIRRMMTWSRRRRRRRRLLQHGVEVVLPLEAVADFAVAVEALRGAAEAEEGDRVAEVGDGQEGLEAAGRFARVAPLGDLVVDGSVDALVELVGHGREVVLKEVEGVGLPRDGVRLREGDLGGGVFFFSLKKPRRRRRRRRRFEGRKGVLGSFDGGLAAGVLGLSSSCLRTDAPEVVEGSALEEDGGDVAGAVVAAASRTRADPVLPFQGRPRPVELAEGIDEEDVRALADVREVPGVRQAVHANHRVVGLDARAVAGLFQTPRPAHQRNEPSLGGNGRPETCVTASTTGGHAGDAKAKDDETTT
eukprot:CAMPEP_0118913954 /NCGR_PEP_ID=MMETSP1166-20130328/14521_1 /TAXON_ID=1104430 /ORGANISM="Chrysoreinhardia sp, Strain CCMP3193" /LENGTH=347 /DNA_ID=CAMNT_0006853519 /DNA_START=81 /DNA_END=1122 /DNA_ORIENTATION=+